MATRKAKTKATTDLARAVAKLITEPDEAALLAAVSAELAGCHQQLPALVQETIKAAVKEAFVAKLDTMLDDLAPALGAAPEDEAGDGD